MTELTLKNHAGVRVNMEDRYLRVLLQAAWDAEGFRDKADISEDSWVKGLTPEKGKGKEPLNLHVILCELT